MSEPVVKLIDLTLGARDCQAGCGRIADFSVRIDEVEGELCEWCLGLALAEDRKVREQLGEERTIWRPPTM